MEKQQRCRGSVLALECALVVLLAGCGVTAADRAGSASNAATNSATATASASAAAATATATVSRAASGVVALTVGTGQYSASDHIVVTIHNGANTTIYAQQHNTSCSVILLERLVNSAWQPVYPCNNGFPHPTVSQIPAGGAQAVRLVPIATGDSEAIGGVWQAGTYRAALSYVTSQTTSFSQGAIAYSGTFAVA